MVRVNILTPFSTKEFMHQLPNNTDEFVFYENGDNNNTYDFIVVYEGLKSKINVYCPKGNLLFISGEPPLSRRYTKGFLSQFDFVISSHPRIKSKQNFLYQQSLPWHFGLDYKQKTYNFSFLDLENLKIPLKTKKMSVIASGKKMMPGHKKRLKFISALKYHFNSEIDFFGKDSTFISDKAEGIIPYNMSICIENSSIDNYWTEKIADVFLGYAIPVYFGCTNIYKYFPERSLVLIDIENINKSINQIDYLLLNCEQIYKQSLPFVLNSRDLLLKKYNIFPFIVEFFKRNKLNANKNIQSFSLHPNNTYSTYKFEILKLKLERFSSSFI